MSSTVTMALHVFTFPLMSVTVSTTGFVPTSAHEKAFGETTSDAIPQLSVEPLSMTVALIVAKPEAFN